MTIVEVGANERSKIRASIYCLVDVAYGMFPVSRKNFGRPKNLRFSRLIYVVKPARTALFSITAKRVRIQLGFRY